MSVSRYWSVVEIRQFVSVYDSASVQQLLVLGASPDEDTAD